MGYRSVIHDMVFGHFKWPEHPDMEPRDMEPRDMKHQDMACVIPC